MDSGRFLADQTTRALTDRQPASPFWAGTITALASPHIKVRPDNATTALTTPIAYAKGITPIVNDRVVGCWVDGEPFVLAVVNT